MKGPSLPVLFLGGALMLIGFALAWPSLYAMWAFERAGGRILEAYPEPTADGEQVRLHVVFDYPIAELDEDQVEVWALGTDRCDLTGGLVEPLTVPTKEWRAWRKLLTDGDERYGTVYYQADDPFRSSRMVLRDGRRSLQRESWGMALMLAPLLAWLCVTLAMVLRVWLNRYERAASNPAAPQRRDHDRKGEGEG